MGTSSSHPSPSTPNWRFAQAVLGNNQVPSSRQSQELWKAAARDNDANLIGRLSSETLAHATQIAETSASPADAIRTYERSIISNHESGLMLDIGKRALARAVALKTGARGFVGELFSETAAYYVDRDMPSYLGTKGRIQTPGEAIDLKRQIRSIAKDTALRSIPSHINVREWQGIVRTIMSTLQGYQSR